MKNYDMIHLIQAAGLSKDVEKVVVRVFNMLNDARDSQGCLTSSVVLCIALEYLGYLPKLCLGKFWAFGHDYYHAWTEIDGKVIDIAIYGNTSFSQYWRDGIIMPQVNKAYDETDVKYEPFIFDEGYEETWIGAVMGWSFYDYCEKAPKRNVVWNMILHCLETSSLIALQRIKEISRSHVIGDNT